MWPFRFGTDACFQSGVLFARWCIVADIAKGTVVINRTYRRAPIINQEFAILVNEGGSTDIKRVGIAIFVNIDTAKIRIYPLAGETITFVFENGFIFDGAGNHDFLLLNRSVGFHLVIDFGNVDLGIFTVRSFNRLVSPSIWS